MFLLVHPGILELTIHVLILPNMHDHSHSEILAIRGSSPLFVHQGIPYMLSEMVLHCINVCKGL